MQHDASRRLEVSSGAPWNLTLSVEWLGTDVLCRIVGGDSHVGAVALAQWVGDRPRARTLTAHGHRETEIARFAARRLCAAVERTVVCVAGIHFDAITRAEIDDISAQARALVEQSARYLVRSARGKELSA